MYILTCRTLARWLAAAWACTALAVPAQSTGQTLAIAAPQNVVSLSAEASREVLQDRLSITLSVSREGTEAAAVQTQLRQALDSALAEARKAQRPNGVLDVRTGAFSLSPRYTAKPTAGNNISGWQGRAELVIEGSDIAAISQLAGRLSMLTVARVAFGLSREAREKTEADVAAQAIGHFKARAEAYAKHFGFGGYSLREVAVNGGEMGGSPQPVFRAQSMSAKSGEESQPVEAGKTTVSVTVAGSIQLSAR
jgi:predicted secreted protein